MGKKANLGAMQRVFSLAETVSSYVTRQDGWINILTGLGRQGKDPRTGMQFAWRPMSETDAEHLEGCDPTAKKIVHWIPREGTRKWISLRMKNDADPKPAQDVNADLERLQAQTRVRKAWAWSRQYGGAGIFLAVDDGQELTEPLNLERIRRINALTVLNRHELSAMQTTTDLADPNFGEPEFYSLTPRQTADQTTQMVHHSRIIKFFGVPLGKTLKDTNDHWGDSALNAVLNSLRNYNLAHDSSATAVNDFRVGVLKLKGLAQLVASDKDDAVMKRINLMQASKSVLSAVALDADSEDFEQRDTKLSGLADVLDRISRRLVADTEMPHTVILGEGAAGTLGGGGESEDRNLAKFVHGSQEEHLTDPINRLIEIVQSARTGPTSGRILEDLTWDFVPLTQPSDKEKADTHNTQADADKKYWEIGALDSDEIRRSRFGTDEFSTETTIDTDDDVTPPLQSGSVESNETVQGNVDAFEPGHSHFDTLLGTFMGPPIDLGRGAHRHDRTNGKPTGPSVNLPNGGHVHETTPGFMSGINIPESALEPVRSDSGDETRRTVALDDVRLIEGKYFVFSESGKRLAGPFDTKEGAEKRLREIEFFKNQDVSYPGKEKQKKKE